jgi:AraC family transcriptional regulator of adaptative response/methylated-DNA-[protein]-cysteine methyltransferase
MHLAPPDTTRPACRNYADTAAFRAGFARATGIDPAGLPGDPRLCIDWIPTPLGPLIAVADARHLYLLEFPERRALPAELRRLQRDARGSLGFGRSAPMDRAQAQLSAYFTGQSAGFDLALAPGGTPFQRAVWDALQTIPAGQKSSYAELARSLGRPDAARAVARANGANRLAIVIPCHRVTASDGALTGYGGGLWRKAQLIEIETQYRKGPQT